MQMPKKFEVTVQSTIERKIVVYADDANDAVEEAEIIANDSLRGDSRWNVVEVKPLNDESSDDDK